MTEPTPAPTIKAQQAAIRWAIFMDLDARLADVGERIQDVIGVCPDNDAAFETVFEKTARMIGDELARCAIAPGVIDLLKQSGR